MGEWERSGASDEWYTPKYVFDAMGVHFDMDAAAPMKGPLHTPCDTWIYDHSLSKPWYGSVWMNPPFGGRNGLAPWMDKFLSHGNGVALTPDRTSAPWFQAAWSTAEMVLFTPKIRFIRPDGTLGVSPANGTALWGVGRIGVQALTNAHKAGLGILAVTK